MSVPATPSPASSEPFPRGFFQALQTFRKAAAAVPAYKDFLAKRSIDPEKISAPADFALIPPIDKENYLTAYPLPDLLWDGKLTSARIISMSSGSSGKPFFWFRGEESLQDSTALTETFFKHSFHVPVQTTLCINAFAMGTWIAGTYILAAFTELAKKGYPVVSITPGINKPDILRILKNVAPHFDQVLIAGYPPFVKDALDEAEGEGVDLPALNIKLLFAGENFSEQWRDYVLHKIGKENDLQASVSIYGTADAGIMGTESPLSIYARRTALQNPDLFSRLFPGTTTLPSLVHYSPEIRYFEEAGEYVVFTTNTSMPLIRYNIRDTGRLITGDALRAALKEAGATPPHDLLSLADRPCVTLYSRTDISAIFYSLNIYPENIKHGLEAAEYQKLVTGKFIVTTHNDERTQQQTLHLYIELKRGAEITPALKKQLFDSVVKSLRAHNSEYNKLYEEIGKPAHPVLHFLPYGSEHFRIKIKHQWTILP